MKTISLLSGVSLLMTALTCFARDVSTINPPFPRIANCYGAGIGWKSWEEGKEYWSKLDLFIGGGYDLHYDWENARWEKTLERTAENIRRILAVNATALFLPYVDVIEGPDNPNVPPSWWALNEKKERWSGWPGYYRINTDLQEVLQFNLDQTRKEIMGRECFDGVFYDCWGPDKWLVPETAKLRDGRAIVMVNQWNLPRSGFEVLNGCLAEDEINRVIDGRVDFEDFLARYLRWCNESRKPCVTTLVCRPSLINDDPWRWSRLSHEERVVEMERAKAADEQTMRFGLATALMGDGYFAYDAGTMGRGNWWWFKEYDAPLGYPKGPARRNEAGTWQREFDGGTVVVNGTAYDVVVELPDRRKDVSTERVGTRFTIPMYDGRIFVPTQDPPCAEADVAPVITRERPSEVRLIALPNDVTAAQTPGGLDLRFACTGALQAILWQGRPLMTGGWPVVAAPPFNYFEARPDPANPRTGAPIPVGSTAACRLLYRGRLVHEDQKVEYVEVITVSPPAEFRLEFQFRAATDLDLRMWRHYFMLPVARFKEAQVTSGDKTITLPAELGEEQLLAGKEFVVKHAGLTIRIESSLNLGLIDHRKWGTDDYLLAGYPVSGQVKEDTEWVVAMTVRVEGTANGEW